jgi:hypothetical protein
MVLYLELAVRGAVIGAVVAAARPTWTVKMETTVGNMPPFGLIVGAGAGLTRTGHPGFGALLLLDALQPVGVNLLQSDPYGLIAALGALAHVNPGAVVQVLDSNALEHLGASFSLSGQPASGKTAMKVKITTGDGQVIQQDILGGHLWVYPLGVGKHAKVEIRVTGRGAHLGGKTRARFTVEGGAAGLIFDARGRPLPLAADPRGRAAQRPICISEATGDALIAIPDEWLETAVDEIGSDTMAQAPAALKQLRADKQETSARESRGGLFGRRGKAKTEAPAPEEADVPEDAFQNELDELRGGR